ncbi:MAG TPA: DUF6282 family protein [Caulobacterales bacterium]|nr:DUF6282 family protein [Caulobacterales bacterium]
MRTAALTIACVVALTFSLAAAAQPAAETPGPVQWAPEAKASVIVPSNDINLDAWAAYRNRQATPSVDQHLTDPILIGAIDLHAHFGPDTYARQWDAFEIARHSDEAGMRAVVFKNHWSESAGLAYLVNRYAGLHHLQAFGGLALNTPEGGINPEAVRYFAEVEGHYARIVWMPTHDSEHEVRALHETRPYVRVSDNGVLLPQVLQVLDLIKHYDLTLATGHVSPEEMLQIVSAAHDRGITRIILTHPGLGPVFTDPTLDQLRQAVAMGGYAEVVASELLGADKDKFVAMIRALGPQHVFVSTDSGLVGTHNHADALVLSIRTLRAAGFSEGDLDLMFRRNPAFLIGLPN